MSGASGVWVSSSSFHRSRWTSAYKKTQQQHDLESSQISAVCSAQACVVRSWAATRATRSNAARASVVCTAVRRSARTASSSSAARSASATGGASPSGLSGANGGDATGGSTTTLPATTPGAPLAAEEEGRGDAADDDRLDDDEDGWPGARKSVVVASGIVASGPGSLLLATGTLFFEGSTALLAEPERSPPCIAARTRPRARSMTWLAETSWGRMRTPSGPTGSSGSVRAARCTRRNATYAASTASRNPPSSDEEEPDPLEDAPPDGCCLAAIAKSASHRMSGSVARLNSRQNSSRAQRKP
mmetsp:Transcript_14694/g.58753  ORF Transcript_14694/g.58753 Transcript_14694/m.58753 type:complete len:302 (-) Transcript_14694:722-1627(-)